MVINLRTSWWWVVSILLISGIKLINLETTPLFGDEAAYCFWGTRVAHLGLIDSWDPMVSEGKIAPVLPFLQVVGWWLLPQQGPLFLCRSVSVALSAGAGFLVFILTLRLSRRLLLSWAAMIFYLVNPFSFFTDRTSLLEPGLNFFVLGVTCLVWLAVTRKKLRLLVVAIALLLVAVLTKLTALLIVPGLIGLVWFSPLRGRQRWWVILGLILVSLVLLWVVTAMGLWAVFEYHAHSGFDISGIARRWLANAHLTRSWYAQYLTSGFFILVFLGGWQLIKERQLGWLLFPIPIVLTYILLADSYFPRFLLLTMPFLAVMVGYAVRTRVGQITLAILLVIWLANDWKLVMQPVQATIAREDYFQFYEDWTSGVGTELAIQWLALSGDKKDLLLPADLLHRAQVYAQSQRPQLALRFKPINDRDQLLEAMSQEDFSEWLMISTTHHSWLQETLSSTYELKLVYATHGDTARSVLIYEVGRKR